MGTLPPLRMPLSCSCQRIRIPEKVSSSDPLVSHGRHFGRTVFALCNYPALLTNGILRLEQMENTSLEDFSAEERREHCVFEQLLDSYPGLLEQLTNSSEEEILHVGELIGKGAAGARGDNTKTLKSAVLDWIAPKGEAIQPPLHRNSKIDRGFNHELTGSLLCPAGLDWNNSQTKEHLRSGELLVCGDQWPVFYPWCGLLWSCFLVCAYKHIFTSPSSVRFALTSSSVFSRTDTMTDLETFDHSLLDLLEDPDELKEVDELLMWWNRQVFPASSAAKRNVTANSALSKIQQKSLVQVSSL
ncbi:uncharacterized protein F5891DRAFT_1130222 [Suillus fuscotomentosus]|uniref:Uncharacterized protein n=1 Tax=Suillus fuscotomentosus TaxID=1912939 RepID=A0AAD4HHU9_9AGAM|nr:uncharacterized protein F5891DRAFT_1130222 [Suillus fuscotomentosus]KAG1896726.1 hypothetical protein F5891DRAFT_1130222 [Suillus fuscotomentosus]